MRLIRLFNLLKVVIIIVVVLCPEVIVRVVQRCSNSGWRCSSPVMAIC